MEENKCNSNVKKIITEEPMSDIKILILFINKNIAGVLTKIANIYTYAIENKVLIAHKGTSVVAFQRELWLIY